MKTDNEKDVEISHLGVHQDKNGKDQRHLYLLTSEHNHLKQLGVEAKYKKHNPKGI